MYFRIPNSPYITYQKKKKNQTSKYQIKRVCLWKINIFYYSDLLIYIALETYPLNVLKINDLWEKKKQKKKREIIIL